MQGKNEVFLVEKGMRNRNTFFVKGKENWRGENSEQELNVKNKVPEGLWKRNLWKGILCVISTGWD